MKEGQKKRITVTYEGRTAAVGWYAGSSEASIHAAIRSALSIATDTPLVLTEPDGAVLAVSDALPDGIQLIARTATGLQRLPPADLQAVDAPGPRPYPLIGNVLEYAGAGGFVGPTLRLTEQHGDFFRLKFFDRYVYICSDPQIVREMLEREAEFPKVVPPDERDPLGNLRLHTAGDGMFTSSDSEAAWQQAHRVLLPAFGAGALKQYFPKMQEVVDDLLRFLDALPSGKPFLATDLMTRLTYEAISYAGFNKRLGIVNDGPSHPFVDAMGEVLLDSLLATWRILPAVLRPGGREAPKTRGRHPS